MALVREIDIVDSAFAHAPGMSWYNVPQFVKWVRGRSGRVPIRFFTDRSIGQVDNYPADVSVALLIEPITLDDTGYNICLGKLPQFKYCLTYDAEFKQKLGDKGLLYAIGGCWLTPAQIGIHPKTKVCSLIASEKMATPGHRMRREIGLRYPGHLNLFGRAFGNYIPSKFTALADFRFSVVAENSQVNDMFTEKIIDCFLTGTVPIYWGTKNLKNYFNMDGVLQFNTLEELDRIMGSLHPDNYDQMSLAIQDNFERALQYRVAEDRIFLDYPFLIP